MDVNAFEIVGETENKARLLFILTVVLYSGCIFFFKELRQGTVTVINGIKRKLLSRIGIHGKE